MCYGAWARDRIDRRIVANAKLCETIGKSRNHYGDAYTFARSDEKPSFALPRRRLHGVKLKLVGDKAKHGMELHATALPRTGPRAQEAYTVLHLVPPYYL